MSTQPLPDTQLQLTSTLTADGNLVLQYATIPVPSPGADEVLIRIEAAPINPSDLLLLMGPADINTLQIKGSGDNTVATMQVSAPQLQALQSRLNKALPVGNEAGGTVVAAGANALALLGKVVGTVGGGMYCQYRCVPARNCLVMPAGICAKQAASSFVNPLTALCMVETMRMEHHTALVHTAAASNLGQMLVKICQADNVPLVNIVRSDTQAALLKQLGAQQVCNSATDGFLEHLVTALDSTGATLAFDAVGGGKLTSQILTAMEISLQKKVTEYSPYGSTVHKQVYQYGVLDVSPTVLSRSFGFAWSVGGWLLTPFIGRLGGERFLQLRQRVASEIDTTFASHYSHEIALTEVLSESAIKAYSRRATGEKYLIRP